MAYPSVGLLGLKVHSAWADAHTLPTHTHLIHTPLIHTHIHIIHTHTHTHTFSPPSTHTHTHTQLAPPPERSLAIRAAQKRLNAVLCRNRRFREGQVHIFGSAFSELGTARCVGVWVCRCVWVLGCVGVGGGIGVCGCVGVCWGMGVWGCDSHSASVVFSVPLLVSHNDDIIIIILHHNHHHHHHHPFVWTRASYKNNSGQTWTTA
jgi:hypothetical protein